MYTKKGKTSIIITLQTDWDGLQNMNIKISEGDYEKIGVAYKNRKAIFTLVAQKEDKCSIVFLDRQTQEKTIIDVSDKYCLGSLRSISVEGFNPVNHAYYFMLNGEKKLDPYATKIYGREKWNDLNRVKEDFEVTCGVAENKFDWKQDVPPELSKKDLMIYKLHVRSFSMGNGNKKNAGTFSAVTNKVEYIRNLGFSAIMLMPVYEFEEVDIPEKVDVPDYVKWEPKNEDMIVPIEEDKPSGKVNLWGYGDGNYFSVKASYASNPLKAANEFKTLVRSFHNNGMEVILEMFFPDNTNHNLILDVLRYWVKEYHVDGFKLMGVNIPVTSVIHDYILSRTKIFCCEYNLSDIPKDRKYKNLYVDREEYLYPVRKILNHMNGSMRELLYQQRKQDENLGFVNFIASNNGFTLADLFMYNDKHNEANGENNTDGTQWNFSNNYGCEGPSKKKFIRNVRKLKWKNAMMLLFLAQGVPLLMAGDEICNSQQGNNNAYCQDNEIGWINWKNDKSNKSNISFLTKLIAFRKSHPVISSEKPYKFCDYKSLGYPDISYHGNYAWISDDSLDKMCIGVMYCGDYSESNSEFVYIGYNFYSYRERLALPTLEEGKKWYLVADTSNESDSFLPEQKECSNQQLLDMDPQAICILVGK